jgi:hypothetical protein
MLYKFKSKETSDLIMLEPHARQILSLIGKESGAQGIVLPDEMAMAIQRLHDAIQAEELAKAEAKRLAAEHAKSEDTTDASNSTDEPARHVSLRQRATPFIDMLKRAQAAHVEVVWGV